MNCYVHIKMAIDMIMKKRLFFFRLEHFKLPNYFYQYNDLNLITNATNICSSLDMMENTIFLKVPQFSARKTSFGTTYSFQMLFV